MDQMDIARYVFPPRSHVFLISRPMPSRWRRGALCLRGLRYPIRKERWGQVLLKGNELFDTCVEGMGMPVGERDY